MQPIDHRDEVAAAPADVVAVLTDRDYLLAYLEELGAQLVSADVDRADGAVRTRLVAVVATGRVPRVFRRLVAAQTTVCDVRTYRPDGSGCDLHVQAAAGGRRVDIDGRLTLAAGGAGTVLHTVATVTAAVPLLGSQVESAVRGLVESRVLTAQTAALSGRLPR